MPRQGLDTARVVEEAARVADAERLNEVTLARVAAELGVRAPSLYNHVDGRAGLLRLLALRSIDELAEAMRDAAVGRAGADALRAIAHGSPTPGDTPQPCGRRLPGTTSSRPPPVRGRSGRWRLCSRDGALTATARCTGYA
jgi:AcrR family transcriptional regulator